MTNQINLNNKILTFRYELSKFSTNFIIGFYSVEKERNIITEPVVGGERSDTTVTLIKLNGELIYILSHTV